MAASDDQALSLDDAGKRLGVKKSRISQLLKEDCLFIQDAKTEAERKELRSPQAEPDGAHPDRGRTVYEWSIENYLGRHRNEDGSRRRHPRRPSTTKSGEQPRERLGSDQILLTRIAQMRDQAKARRAEKVAELHRLADEITRLDDLVRHQQIDLEAAQEAAADDSDNYEAIYAYVIDKFGPQGTGDFTPRR